jgi:hypothetical protein
MKDSQPNLVVAIGDRPEGKEGDGNLTAASAAQNVDTVPLNSLEMPDDQEQMQPPEVGDEVNYQITGKVVAIEGNMAKVQRTSINGQEIEGASEDANGTPDDEAAESQNLRQQAGGMGMMMAFMLFLCLALSARGQNAAIETPYVTGSVSGTLFTNAYVLPNQPARCYSIQGYNSNTVAIAVMVFQTNAVPANGALPLLVQTVPAQSGYKFDFGYAGCWFDTCTVAASTTTNTLTLSSAPCITVVSIESQR